eukprot:3226208-Amphidinium_carterae.2
MTIASTSALASSQNNENLYSPPIVCFASCCAITHPNQPENQESQKLKLNFSGLTLQEAHQGSFSK